MIDTDNVHWQYCQGDRDITGEMYAEDDADEMRVWYPDGTLGVSVGQLDLGGWQITGSDYGHVVMDWTQSFDTPAEAWEYVQRCMREQA